MPKISIIVPVYKVEKYLNRCVDSILKQTFIDFELILIDDGSPDNSGKICDDYAKQDDRVKVIKKQNGGQSLARNIGIDIAKGEFIGFVDSDDWISCDMYQYMIEIIEKTDSDIADICYVMTTSVKTETNIKGVVNKETTVHTLNGKEILNDYLIEGMKTSSYSLCRKLYKSSLFKGIRLPSGKIHEELAFNYKVLSNAKKLVKSNKVCYFYFQQSISTTRTGLSKKDFDLLENCNELCELTKNETYKNIKSLAEDKLARSYFSLLAKIAYYGFDDDILLREQVVKDLTQNLRKNYWKLMKSPMPYNRKLMATALTVNFNLLASPLKIYKKIKGNI